jgi:uncharacterized protein YidB (DUF937 family)
MNPKTLLRFLVPGVVGVGVALGAVGITAYAAGIHLLPAAAASPSPKTAAGTGGNNAASYCSDYVNHLASDLNTTSDKVSSAAKQAFDQTIDDAVKNGDLTAAQANSLKAKASGTGICSAALSGLGRAKPSGGLAGATQAYLAAAAKELGMQTADLQAALKNGQTLHQLADQKGISEADFRTGVINNLKPQLDQAVKDGKITQAQEDEAINRLKTGPLPLWDRAAARQPKASPTPVA